MFENKNIKIVKPIGVQLGGLTGPKFVVEVKTAEEDFYAFALPPKYSPLIPAQKYEIDAAIAKYGYDPIDNDLVITTEESWQEFLQGVKNNRTE